MAQEAMIRRQRRLIELDQRGEDLPRGKPQKVQDLAHGNLSQVWYLTVIQTTGDILTIVAIIALGVVSFLFAIFLYHLIFIVMDLREVMRRLNALTGQIEEMLVQPVELVSDIVEWVKEKVWDVYFAEPKKRKKRKKGG